MQSLLESFLVSSGHLPLSIEKESQRTCPIYVTNQNKNGSFPKSQPMGKREDGFPIKDVGNDREGGWIVDRKAHHRQVVESNDPREWLTKSTCSFTSLNPRDTHFNLFLFAWLGLR